MVIFIKDLFVSIGKFGQFREKGARLIRMNNLHDLMPLFLNSLPSDANAINWESKPAQGVYYARRRGRMCRGIVLRLWNPSAFVTAATAGVWR